MKIRILKPVLAALLAAISTVALGVESPQPALLFWDQLMAVPEGYRQYRPLDLDAAARGIEMTGGSMPCILALADPPQMAVTGYLVPSVQMVQTRVQAIREYRSLDGAVLVRFETPQIASAAFPDPRNPPLTLMIAPGPFAIDPANPQYSRFASYEFMGTNYYLEDGSSINSLLLPISNLGCRGFPMRRGSTGIAEAGRQEYFAWSLALTGSYQLPSYGYYSPYMPPVPPCDTPPCPAPPLPPRLVTDVSVYWFGVYGMNGALIWERTYPGFDGNGWSMRAGIGISGIANHLPGHRGDEVLIARSRPVAGTPQVEYWYQYLDLATGDLLLERQFAVIAPILAPPAPPPPPPPPFTVPEPPAPCASGLPPPCPPPANQPPDGAILGWTPANAWQPVTFTGSGSDPDGNLPLSYFWNFGPTAIPPTSTAQNPVEVFPAGGVYTVTLTVTDALGMQDPSPASVAVQVGPSLPPP